jgi:hypothetical protein
LKDARILLDSGNIDVCVFKWHYLHQHRKQIYSVVNSSQLFNELVIETGWDESAQLNKRISLFKNEYHIYAKKQLLSAISLIDQLSEIINHLPHLKTMRGFIRNFSPPGDHIWHQDICKEPYSYRILISIGRKNGTLYTNNSNILEKDCLDWLKKNENLLKSIDRNFYCNGSAYKMIMNHLITKNIEWIINPNQIFEGGKDAILMHRMQCPSHSGSWHQCHINNIADTCLMISITIGMSS